MTKDGDSMNIRLRAGIFALGLLLPGCMKYYELSTTEFPQGSLVEQKANLAQQYLRSIKLYDQFATVALFDSLWLSPDVRTYFAKRFCDKRGKDSETHKAIQNRQLEETNHWIGFYVLADIRTRNHTSLNEKNAAWTFYLTVNKTTKLEPISMKEAELEPEYLALFGRCFNNFKTTYLVKFPAYGLDGKPYINSANPELSLHVCGPAQEGIAQWNIGPTPQTIAVNNEDFYWV